MDNFNVIFDTLFKKLKSGCLLEETSLYFSYLKSDYERFKFCMSVLEDAKLLPSLVLSSKKNSVESEKYRNEGNKAFLKRDDVRALEFYSISVALALEGSKEIALAFANRSAVSFSLNHYEDCIIDINRALSGTYPEHLLYKLFERKGKCFLHLKKLESAKECFNNALNVINKSNLNEEKIKSFIEVVEEVLKGINSNNCDSNTKSRCLNLDDVCTCKMDKISQELMDNCHEMPNLSYQSSITISGACDAITIEYNKEMGRHIIAYRDIEPGDVLMIERPYASVLLPTSYNLYCFNCLKRCHTLLPCEKCTKALFCSETCKNSSATNSHKIECGVLDHLIQLGCTKLELLAVRTLLTVSRNTTLEPLRKCIIDIEKQYSNGVGDERLKGFDENNQYRSNNYATVHWLAANTELRTNADLFRRSCFACCIIHCIDSLSDYFVIDTSHPKCSDENDNSEDCKDYLDVKCFAGSLLLKYLQIMPCNAHEVSEMCLISRGKCDVDSINEDGDNTSLTYDSKEIGGALYPLLSLINHSCDPNVVRHSHQGDTVVLTAIQFIPKGGQIFDNYGYHHAVHDRQTRQNYLLSQYHFTCKCTACVEDWPRYHLLPDQNIIYKSPTLKQEVEKSSSEFRKTLKYVLQGNYNKDNLNRLTRHLLLLQNAVVRPWKEYSECQEAIKQTLSMFANHYVYTSVTK